MRALHCILICSHKTTKDGSSNGSLAGHQDVPPASDRWMLVLMLKLSTWVCLCLLTRVIPQRIAVRSGMLRSNKRRLHNVNMRLAYSGPAGPIAPHEARVCAKHQQILSLQLLWIPAGYRTSFWRFTCTQCNWLANGSCPEIFWGQRPARNLATAQTL